MRLETALADNGDQYPVVVDADMRIIPEIFIFANFLCGTKLPQYRSDVSAGFKPLF